MLPHNVRDDLLKRVRPNRPHTAELRKAVEQCFTFAEAVDGERRGLSHDMTLNAATRRDALGRFVTGDLFQPLANALNPLQKVKAHVEAERSKLKPWQSGLPRDVAELAEDVGVVEAALYFAKREIEEAERTFRGGVGLSSRDLDALLVPSHART